MFFNVLARASRVALLAMIAASGCSKSGSDRDALNRSSSNDAGGCQNAPLPLPAESCASAIRSLDESAKRPRLRSTELTAGLYTAVSNEVFVDHPLKGGARLRVQAREATCMNPGSEQVFSRMEILCREANNLSTAPVDLKQFAPRLIRISRDERVADAAFRGAVITTPGGSLVVGYDDFPKVPKMGMTRSAFQSTVSAAFDESYFIRDSAMSYVFVGKKKLATGSVQIIRVNYRKTEGEVVAREKPRLDPVPDGIFKL